MTDLITDPCAGCPYAVEHIACLRSLPDDFCKRIPKKEEPEKTHVNFDAAETD
ncbi:MAG: hypothetical protein NTZ13_00805 [Candidatus Parcubacteria bacterium]|nr:hypothetical protein [Candidatus Parcubacteria bacterium]